MKVPNNYKEIIESNVNGEWTLLGTRTQAPPLPVVFKFFPLSSEFGEKLYGVSVPTVIAWENDVGKFYVQNKQYKQSIANVTKLLFNPTRVKTHVSKVLALCRQTVASAKFFKRKNLSKYPSELLLQEHKKVTDLYAETFLRGYVTWCAQVLQEEGLRAVSGHKDALTALNLNPLNAFGILVVSKQKSMYARKEEALESLAKKFQHMLKKEPKRDSETVKKKFPRVHEKILEYLETYEWVGYDYGGPVMSYREVIESVIGLELHGKAEKVSQKDILKICPFSEREKEIFKVFSLVSLIKDERNACDDFVHYCLDNFYSEASKRIALSRTEARYLWPNELVEALLRKKSFNAEYIRKKFSFCYVCINDGRVAYGVGEEAKKALALILEDVAPKEASRPIRKLKGMSASPGHITGIVRIVRSYDEVSKVKKGDILVTAMTSPRFMLGIHRAAAIVTDEGGLTCHAAIIARELGKPCIIGTKIATKVLKDGDVVEVNAGTGIVKIIKK